MCRAAPAIHVLLTGAQAFCMLWSLISVKPILGVQSSRDCSYHYPTLLYRKAACPFLSLSLTHTYTHTQRYLLIFLFLELVVITTQFVF